MGSRACQRPGIQELGSGFQFVCISYSLLELYPRRWVNREDLPRYDGWANGTDLIIPVPGLHCISAITSLKCINRSSPQSPCLRTHTLHRRSAASFLKHASIIYNYFFPKSHTLWSMNSFFNFPRQEHSIYPLSGITVTVIGFSDTRNSC